MVTYVGQYPDGTPFSRTSYRAYTHAVIPCYTTVKRYAPSPEGHGRRVSVEEPCEPWYDRPKFCGSLALAQKAAKTGWVIVALAVEED